MIGAAPYRGIRPSRRTPWPRRDRRGLAALYAMMMLAAVAVSATLLLQVGIAGERLRGESRHLAAAVAAEGYGLHHWLHEERVAGSVAAPAEGQARVLSTAEEGRLAAHSAMARWRRTAADATLAILPRGWDVVHLVGRAGDLPDGVLVLRAADDLVALPSWAAAWQALDVTLGAAEPGAAALATVALAASPLDDYDAARDRAVLASGFAGLDKDALLREPHAGHARQPMATGILMGGNDVTGVGRLAGQRGQLPQITGTCIGTTLCAAALTLGDTLTANNGATLDTATAEDVTVIGNVTGITRVRTASAEVSGTVTTPVLTACADASADLCGGGDLDLESGTGTPHWTEAAIFGDTVIRDGNRLMGVRQTTAATGIFGRLVGALTVSGCFRSVSPFIYGPGC